MLKEYKTAACNKLKYLLALCNEMGNWKKSFPDEVEKSMDFSVNICDSLKIRSGKVLSCGLWSSHL